MYHHGDYRSHHDHARQADFRPSVNRSVSETSPVIVLDEYNSDLNFVIEENGCTGSTLHKDGFEYMWAGARSTYGVSRGKVCYEVLILENLPVSMPDTERTPHVARVGWSTDSSNLNVGEDKYSYGYGGTGKSSLNCKFLDYGEPYNVKDVVSCYIDFDNSCMFFSKNGKYLGPAFNLAPETRGMVFYPHITIKNMKVQVNFGQYPPLVPPVRNFTMINHVPKDWLTRATRGPDTHRDCQVIMMVGLPAAGKTVWAKKFTEEHNDLRVNILGTNTIMDKMKVTGLTRNRNYHGRWDQLIKQATEVLNKTFKIAEKKKRNYILDQTNVYPRARARKMSSFHDFRRIAAVVVNTNEVLKERTERRERDEGKIVPEKAVMAMKANFTLPEVGESFDDVWFIEQDQQTSERLVEEFRQEGKLFEEKERERELKRKREEMSGGGEPPPKEPCNTQHDHNRQNHIPQYHPRGHQHSSYHPPSDHRNEPPRQHYPPGARGAVGQSTQGYPPRAHGNEPPPHPQGAHGHFDPRYPPWGHGGHNPTYEQQNYRPTLPAQQPYVGYYQQPQYAQHNAGYYSHPTGYPDNPAPFSIPESQYGGCSSYDPLMNNPYREPQEHDVRDRNRRPQVNDDRYCTQRHNPHYGRGGYNY